MTDDPSSRHDATFAVAPGHPSLPGHFPGHPVVPGVVVLDEVLGAFAHWQGAADRVDGLPAVKFIAPLLPGRLARVSFTRSGRSCAFTVTDGEVPIARGTFTLGPVAP